MWRFIAVVALATCASCLFRPVCALAEINLAKNGDLAAGFDGAPADWYALSSDRKLSKFSWDHTQARGTLQISNLSPNYASWHQALILPAGIYQISADVSVEGAKPRAGGANIAVVTYDGIRVISEHLHGTTGWRTLSFYLEADQWGDTIELLCQLGVAGYPDTGRASFRNIKVIPVKGPTSFAARGFALPLIRYRYREKLPQPDNRVSIRLTGVVSGLALLGILGWALAVIWRPALAARRSAWMLPAGLMLAVSAIKFAALFHFTGFYWDILSKTNRALLATALGPSRIYDPGLPVDFYPPGSLYLLWLSGWIARLVKPDANGLRVIVETPPLIADLFIGLTLYFALWREGRSRRALVAMMLFALNPALLYDTVVWGQSEPVVALPMLAAALLVLAGRYRLGWSVAAIAILAKPQAIALMPPLGLWTLFNAGVGECAWSAGAFCAALAIGIIPYQIGHSWDWIINIYEDLGTRFSEASVGAFNFMGLIGGMGAPDTDKVIGAISFSALGLSLTCAVYLISSYLIWRARSARGAMLAIFVALFGFFIFAPRMHERYLYYPVVFLIPIALESRFLTSIFAVVSATFLFNVAYIKHLSDTSTYFPDHPNAALIAAASINLAMFFAAAGYGLLRIPWTGEESLLAETTPPGDSIRETVDG